jgi:membrane-associated HD superfamily phosphohydrolase
MVLLLPLLGILILVGGLVATIALAGKGDHNYHKSTKSNVTRLISIYILLLLVIVIGFAFYLF